MIRLDSLKYQGFFLSNLKKMDLKKWSGILVKTLLMAAVLALLISADIKAFGHFLHDVFHNC